MNKLISLPLSFYLGLALVIVLIAATVIWGLPALVIAALSSVPLIFAFFIFISLPRSNDS